VGDGSVAIRRVGSYAVDYPLIPLETVAGKTRVMEDNLISAAGNDVTPAFHDYLRPLLGADVIEVARLRAAKVEKAGVLMGDST
jgi:ATP-dependent phosphofructokinase / diphosphate-dependent phosphofructokinase